MIIAATGHRPERIGGHDLKTRRALGALAVEALSRLQPDQVISGMALGWDQAVAAAAHLLNIPFIAAVPFPGQHSLWPDDAERRYHRLLDLADKVVFVSDIDVPVNKALQKRNEWMVDRANRMLALWDGSFGGTHNCIVYARKRGVPVDNLWPYWSMPEIMWELL